MYNCLNPEIVTLMAKDLFKEERAKTRVDSWFQHAKLFAITPRNSKTFKKELRAAHELKAVITELPLSISEHAIFAGSQSDAFARSYALINPSFRVETFSGY